jgi:hypothetical protein
MAQTTAPPLTKYDYWELPEACRRYQLINGDLFMAPAPNRFHQDISRTIQFDAAGPRLCPLDIAPR